MRRTKRSVLTWSTFWTVAVLFVSVHFLRYLSLGFLEFTTIVSARTLPTPEFSANFEAYGTADAWTFRPGYPQPREARVNEILVSSLGAVRVKRFLDSDPMERFPLLRQFESYRFFEAEVIPTRSVWFSMEDVVPAEYKLCKDCDTGSPRTVVFAEKRDTLLVLAHPEHLNVLLAEAKPVAVPDLESLVNLLRPPTPRARFSRVVARGNADSLLAPDQDPAAFLPTDILTHHSHTFTFYTQPGGDHEGNGLLEEWTLQVSRKDNTLTRSAVLGHRLREDFVLICGNGQSMEAENTFQGKDWIGRGFDFLFYRGIALPK